MMDEDPRTFSEQLKQGDCEPWFENEAAIYKSPSRWTRFKWWLSDIWDWIIR